MQDAILRIIFLYKCENGSNSNNNRPIIQFKSVKLFQNRNFSTLRKKFVSFFLPTIFGVAWKLKKNEKKTVSFQTICLSSHNLVYAPSQITSHIFFSITMFFPVHLLITKRKVSTEMSKSGFNLWNCHRKRFICTYLLFYLFFFASFVRHCLTQVEPTHYVDGSKKDTHTRRAKEKNLFKIY